MPKMETNEEYRSRRKDLFEILEKEEKFYKRNFSKLESDKFIFGSITRVFPDYGLRVFYNFTLQEYDKLYNLHKVKKSSSYLKKLIEEMK